MIAKPSVKTVRDRRGSIYALTLLTVAAVGSMVMIGVSVRTATGDDALITSQMNENSDGVLHATEYALARITSDPDWVSTVQKGRVFPDFSLGGRAYSGSILDADTLAPPTGSTRLYRLTVDAASGIARDSASIELGRVDVDYVAYLESLGVDAYWPLDEGANAKVAHDAVSNRNGSYLDKSVSGAAKNDEGAPVPLFAGSGYEIETKYDNEYIDDTEGTVSLWVKFSGTSGSTVYGLFGQRFTGSGRPGVAFLCYAGGYYAYMDDGGSYDSSHYAQTSNTTVKRDQWQHIAMTWGGDGLHIYVDGELEARNAGCTEYWDTQDGASGRQPLMIGASVIPDWSTATKTGFIGSIAHFAILTEQLGDDEIAELAEVVPDGETISIVEQSWTPRFD